MVGSQWSFLVELIRPHRRAFAAYGALLAVATALPIIGTLLISRFVALVIDGADVGRVAPIGLGYAGIGLASSIVGVLVTWRSTALAWRVTNGLRHELASHVLYADLSFHRDRTPGELLTRCDADVTSLTMFLSGVVARLVGIALLAAVSVIVLGLTEPRLAPVLLIGYTILVATMWRVKDLSTTAVLVERTIDAEMNSAIEQYLAGAEDVASMGAGAHGVGRMAVPAGHLVTAVGERVRYEMRVQGSVKSVAAGCMVAILAVGTFGISRGWADVAGVVLAFQLVQIVRGPVEHLTWRLQDTHGVAGATLRIIDLLDERRQVTSGTGRLPEGPLDLRFEATGLVYDDALDGETALGTLDLHLAAGRVVGLVGRSGSGKTTVARLVLRLVSPTSGRLLVGGTDIAGLDDVAFRERVGAIPQDVQMFPGSVRDNVTMFADVADASVIDALRGAGLSGWFDDLTAGLDTRLSADGRSDNDSDAGLSAGEAQLLAIARALLRQPDLVVLDEATSRVDPATQAAISDALSRLVAGRTGLIIAHRLETLDVCDDIAVLADGELIEFGARETLAADPTSHYARLRAVGADAEELAEASAVERHGPRRFSGERRMIVAGNFRALPYWVGTVAWIAFFVSPIVPGWLIGRIFDEAFQAGDTSARLIALLVALAVAELAMIWGIAVGHRTYMRGRESATALMRANVVDAQLASGGPRAGARNAPVGDVLVRLRDDPPDMMFLLDNWADLIGAAIYSMAAGYFLVRIDPWAAFAGIAPLLMVGWGNRAIAHLARRYRARARATSSEVSDFLAAAFEASLTVKVAGAQPNVLRRLARLNEKRSNAAVGDGVWNEVIWTLNATMADVFVGVALVVAARGTLTAGEVTQFFAYLAGMTWLPMRIGGLIAGRRRYEVSAERLNALVATPPERVWPDSLVAHRALPVLGGPDVASPRRSARVPLQTLEVRGITVAARGLHQVDLTVVRGELVVVSGPVGSGKSSLLRAVVGLLDVDSGVVRWNGEDVVDRAAFFVPPNCSYVAQVPRLFAESLADNLRLGHDLDSGALSNGIELAALDEDVAQLPDGLATMLGARGVRLSGGQVQRAAGARAMAHAPELLVLDDMTSALDVDTEVMLWRRLAAAGFTVLAASNRPVALERADQVIELEVLASR